MKILNKMNVLSAMLLMMLAWLSITTAQAVAPAQAIISNTATLTYTGNTAGTFASVNIKVLLSPAATTLASPTGVAPANNTVAVNQSSKADYLVVANANGVDTYLISGVSTPTSVAGSSATISYKQGGVVVTSLVLGATAASVQANIGATTISVPSDGVANGNLNGIVNGDEVRIGNASYLVNITDSAAGVVSTVTLIAGTLSSGSPAPTTLQAPVPVGTLISEQQVVTMVIADVGVISGAGPQVLVLTTVKSSTDNTKVAQHTHVTTVVSVLFEKFVRNNSGANPVAAGQLINGITYYATADSLSAVSGDILEYVIRVTTDTAAGVAGAVVTNPMPLFTTYIANSTRLNGKTVAGDGAASPLVSGLTVDDDVPVRAAGAGATGTIAANSTAIITFQVTLD